MTSPDYRRGYEAGYQDGFDAAEYGEEDPPRRGWPVRELTGALWFLIFLTCCYAAWLMTGR